jgi:hypothetical protein
LVGQQPSEPGGALDERGTHHASTRKWPRGALLKEKQGPLREVKPRTLKLSNNFNS